MLSSIFCVEVRYGLERERDRGLRNRAELEAAAKGERTREKRAIVNDK